MIELTFYRKDLMDSFTIFESPHQSGGETSMPLMHILKKTSKDLSKYTLDIA
jgi:hypothetical protein